MTGIIDIIKTNNTCVIPLVIFYVLLLDVNHHQPLLDMPNKLVYINSTEKCMNQFAIRYMVNPILNFNKVFRETKDKRLR